MYSSINQGLCLVGGRAGFTMLVLKMVCFKDLVAYNIEYERGLLFMDQGLWGEELLGVSGLWIPCLLLLL